MQVKVAMISGLWANTNLDDGKQTREKALQEIEDSFREAINRVYADSSKEQHDILDEHPFFKAIKRGEQSIPTTTTEA